MNIRCISIFKQIVTFKDFYKSIKLSDGVSTVLLKV